MAKELQVNARGKPTKARLDISEQKSFYLSLLVKVLELRKQQLTKEE